MKKMATVREYLAAVPARHRAALEKVRRAVKSAAPGATEYIGYGMPIFKYRDRRLVAMAAFTNHCSLFPMSKAVIAALKDELGRRETSKGTIRFLPEKPLSDALVKKIVRARIRENEARWPSG
jgi:uncharacterized protein YdhG (YjbR/CyaY superfamily)